MPSAELGSALGTGAEAAPHIAKRPELLAEKRRLDLAFYERLDARSAKRWIKRLQTIWQDAFVSKRSVRSSCRMCRAKCRFYRSPSKN